MIKLSRLWVGQIGGGAMHMQSYWVHRHFCEDLVPVVSYCVWYFRQAELAGQVAARAPISNCPRCHESQHER